MARNHYLCKRPGPGEIKQEPEATGVQHMNVLTHAAELVEYGLKTGLLRKPGYGLPKPPAHNAKEVDEYPCVRAWSLRLQGWTHAEISKEIKCSTAKLKDVLDRGQILYDGMFKRPSTNVIAKSLAETNTNTKVTKKSNNNIGTTYANKDECRKKSIDKAPYSGKRVANAARERKH